jgi:hypothetical protein
MNWKQLQAFHKLYLEGEVEAKLLNGLPKIENYLNYDLIQDEETFKKI